MSKRNKNIIETDESRALKELCLHSELSLRKLGERMNISSTRVHQLETGRENISKEYIDQFLSALDLNRSAWPLRPSKEANKVDLRDACHELIEDLRESKLSLIYQVLCELS